VRARPEVGRPFCAKPGPPGLGPIARRDVSLTAFATPLDDDCPFRIDRSPRRRRQVDAGRVFNHPADLLKALPGVKA
jgi:hypothetical protein